MGQAIATTSGPSYLGKGLRLWRTRPRLMLLGMVPGLVVGLLLLGLLVLLILFADDAISWATPFADDWTQWFRQAFRVLLYVGVVAGAAMVSVLTFTGLTLAVGDPFYERIWKEIEREIGGDIPDRGVGWMRGAIDGLALIPLGVMMAVIVFLVGFLPVVGTILGIVLGLVVSGRALAAELVSRPLEARGMDRHARAELMRPHRGAMLGFGICTQACFLIPLGGILVMPAAVAGATYLARDALDAAAPLRRQ